jgi:hypothetical protein
MELWDLINRASGVATLVSFPVTILATIAAFSGWGKVMVTLKKSVIAFAAIALAVVWVADISVRAGLFTPAIHEIHDQVFHNVAVPLDGYGYYHCKFYNVTFVINGTGPVAFVDNDLYGYWVESDNSNVQRAILIMNGLGFIRFPIIENGKIVPPFGEKPTFSGHH